MSETISGTPPVPLLEEVWVRNGRLPLWDIAWVGLVELGLRIRQRVSLPINRKGLNIKLNQNETTKRGVLTIWARLPYKKFAKPKKKAGVDSYIEYLCSLINLVIQGYEPIRTLQLARTTQDCRHLAYYGTFYSKRMEVILYIGSGRDIDGATTVHMRRSYVDEETRDWDLLLEQLPLTILIRSE